MRSKPGSQRGSAAGRRRALPGGRNDQIVRVLSVLRDLDRLGGVTVYELAERYGTDVRTIRRDLAALEQAGFPIDSSERDGARKRHRIDARAALGRLAALLDASHYLALRIAMEPGAPMQRRSTVFATLEDLGAKIESAIGPAGRARLAAIEACFATHERRAYRELAPDVLWPLVDAIAERRVCRVTYRSPRAGAGDRTFPVLPLQLFAWDGGLYLTCHDARRGAILKLNLQRLRALRVLLETAKPPADFDATAFEHAAFGIFVGGAPTAYCLRFDEVAAPYIRERTWHPTQELRDVAGGVELRFRCHASYEVAAWVQGWGEHVRVEAPASLRAELARLGRWLEETYRSPLRVPAARKSASRRSPRSRRQGAD
jgi:proteasome accessory factor B